MIAPDRFVEHLDELGVSMFTGVPDSLLKPFSQYVMDALPREHHVITANEGAAVGLAIGHFLRTRRPALVYLQNSGLGNTVNPLLSLADPEVYGIPMLLVVGWRGQPGVRDEPQHVKQGRVMTAMLDAMELPHVVLPHEQNAALECVTRAVECAIDRSTPFVIVVEKGTFAAAPSTAADQPAGDERPSREHAVARLVDAVSSDAIIVSTTGMLSRELFELRERSAGDGSRDFLTVGGMGHAVSIALGVAAAEPDREVWCFDGDGALLMHMGTMAVAGDHAPPNFYHAVFNNGVHDSVGGQPTSIDSVDIPTVATAVGYSFATTASDVDRLDEPLVDMRRATGPSLIELVVRPGARSDLGRPTRTPRESRDRFLDAVTSSQ